MKVSENLEMESSQVDLLNSYSLFNKQFTLTVPFQVVIPEIEIGGVWGCISFVYT